MLRYKRKINEANTFGVNELIKEKPVVKSANCTCGGPELSIPFLDQDYLQFQFLGIQCLPSGLYTHCTITSCRCKQKQPNECCKLWLRSSAMPYLAVQELKHVLEILGTREVIFFTLMSISQGADVGLELHIGLLYF